MKKHHNTRQEANQANAQLSTGPKTEEGKRIASHNAVKTGLTGRTVLLPTDDVSAFEAHMDAIEKRYRPATNEERQIAENIGHIEWRLLRIPTLETSLLALGRKQFADHHADETFDNRRALIEAEVLLAYGKQLANLALQETRLQRQHEKQRTRLEALLKARDEKERALTTEAVRLYMSCEETDKPFPLEYLREIGFEFPLHRLKPAVAELKTRNERTSWPKIRALSIEQDLELNIA